MDNTSKPEQKNVPGKKEMKKLLADKIAAAIPELKATLGEKKFDNRIKKAVKHITEGIHKKEAAKAAKKAKAANVKLVKKAIATKKTKAVKKADL